MSVLSTVSTALLSALAAYTILTAVGCGTDAKGVDDCRDIEEARCTAAKNCGLVSDAAECRSFYRDQCLHGLAVSPPGSPAIKSCVAAIRAAGQCALQGPDTLVSDCANEMLTAPSAQTACDIVSNPERASECSFLAPAADAGTPDSAATGAAGASSGGTDDTSENGGAGGASE